MTTERRAFRIAGWHALLLAGLLGLSQGCRHVPPAEPVGDDDVTAEEPTVREVPPPTVVAAAERVVAIGDVHGDLAVTRTALTLAGAIDDQDAWAGGALVVVQTGDQIDRGDDDRAILDWFEVLADEAHAAGGAVYTLSGNHEVMNVELDLRYVSDGSLDAFADIEYDPTDPELADLPEEQRGRAAAFRPGGPYAQLLAGRNVVQMVGDVVFVHGGVLPDHVEHGIEVINGETQAWMRGETEEPDVLDGSDSPIWARNYSEDPDDDDCALLDEALAGLGAATMVVGHTRQEEITSACDGKVWLIDVGMAAYYGGTAAVLEIEGGVFDVLQ